MSRTDEQRLEDILDAAAAIDRAQDLGRTYSYDPEVAAVVLAAVEFHVFTIGEAVKGLSAGVKARRPEVLWSDIARMRDLIGHHYFRLDAEIVAATIGRPLEALRAACEDLTRPS